MLTPWALVAVYAAGGALFLAGAWSGVVWVLAAGVALVASAIAIQNGGDER